MAALTGAGPVARLPARLLSEPLEIACELRAAADELVCLSLLVLVVCRGLNNARELLGTLHEGVHVGRREVADGPELRGGSLGRRRPALLVVGGDDFRQLLRSSQQRVRLRLVEGRGVWLGAVARRCGLVGHRRARIGLGPVDTARDRLGQDVGELLGTRKESVLVGMLDALEWPRVVGRPRQVRAAREVLEVPGEVPLMSLELLSGQVVRAGEHFRQLLHASNQPVRADTDVLILRRRQLPGASQHRPHAAPPRRRRRPVRT
eukprot:scaffold39571_cov70-Phaeocystis_antarctica.AAC.10